MTDASRLRALRLIRQGRVFDLGQPYSRRSFKWPGHNPGEIVSFRSPDGIHRMGDPDAPARVSNRDLVLWHSCALFLSDNVATQIDGLGHITAGPDHHWYNGFREEDWGGDWGIRRADATTIPPIVARGLLIDVPAARGIEALPSHEVVTRAEIEAVLRRQDVELMPGDVVLIRTGTGRYWGAEGADHARLAAHDSAGPDLDTVRWLVEQKGALMIGSDTSGLEVSPPPGDSGSGIPVHRYLLVDQGVHIAELHNLEELCRESIYEFCYVAQTNKIRGTAAGFALRPIAIR